MKRVLMLTVCAALVACTSPKPAEVEAPAIEVTDSALVFSSGAPTRFDSVILHAAMAQTPGYVQTTQTLTGDAPTATTSGWFSLYGWTHFRVYVCADTSARTLSGAGSLRAFYKHDSTGLVMRNPSLDLNISVASTGATSCDGAACRCQVFSDMKTSGVGAVYFMADGVTTSAGTQALVGVIGGKQ